MKRQLALNKQAWPRVRCSTVWLPGVCERKGRLSLAGGAWHFFIVLGTGSPHIRPARRLFLRTGRPRKLSYSMMTEQMFKNISTICDREGGGLSKEFGRPFA